MKIAKIETRTAFGGRQTWVFVLVHTADGAVGVGEASVAGRERAVMARRRRGRHLGPAADQ